MLIDRHRLQNLVRAREYAHEKRAVTGILVGCVPALGRRLVRRCVDIVHIVYLIERVAYNVNIVNV